MTKLFINLWIAILCLGTSIFAAPYELVMVEREGCVYCARWKKELEPIYPKTQAGAYAPLRKMDIAETKSNSNFKMPVVYTPTFVLMDDGHEISRMEGYASQDFFWGLLEMMLERETDFVAVDKK